MFQEPALTNARLAALDLALHKAEIAYALSGWLRRKERFQAEPVTAKRRLYFEQALVILACDPISLSEGLSVSEYATELAQFARPIRVLSHAL